MTNKEIKEQNYLCRYNVPNMIFMLKDKKVVLDATNILSIEKIDDFERNIRSIIKVTIRIDINKKLWLMKNKRFIKCKFELNKFGMDLESEKNIKGKQVVWNNEFSIYFSDDDENIDTKILDKRSKLNNNKNNVEKLNSEDYFESENVMDVYLFETKLMEASNKPYNQVFTSSLLQNIIASMLTQTKHKKVLMSRIENNEVYNELIIPANPLYKGLIYLDQYYGLYKTGAIIFYDVDTLYILNSNGKITAKRKDEWREVNFIVDTVDKVIPGNGMRIKEKQKKFYVNLSEMDVVPKKFSEMNNERKGSEIKVVMVDDTTITTSKSDQSVNNKNNEVVKYLKSTNNKYTSSIITARMEENDCIIYISAENLDLSIFTPNKEYKIIFTETEKQKRYGIYKYRIAYAYHFIEKESTNYMKSSHRIVLKKCSK